MYLPFKPSDKDVQDFKIVGFHVFRDEYGYISTVEFRPPYTRLIGPFVLILLILFGQVVKTSLVQENGKSCDVIEVGLLLLVALAIYLFARKIQDLKYNILNFTREENEKLLEHCKTEINFTKNFHFGLYTLLGMRYTFV